MVAEYNGPEEMPVEYGVSTCVPSGRRDLLAAPAEEDEKAESSRDHKNDTGKQLTRDPVIFVPVHENAFPPRLLMKPVRQQVAQLVRSPLLAAKHEWIHAADSRACP